ncbi:nucleoid occlusion factor SlmA [Xylophilus sp. GOD-11R]|uniref:nucleoid occlusion factor SlmA n=1 Tax=Xylophilus sp. GOD-11R TaxID=3089814 RepID=UPI00298C2CD0|nr:nucleoid occlusion factor SlmA [Xylophilus sp. GOD-11R]WPB57809.1 nucleoid occlusion factor SlmA [Xylophilus sp. GOD-11R]
MSEAALNSTEEPQSADAPASSTRKRPKPGERRVQILRALAEMLEKPGAERVTTAALAARLDVSEAALYRHFASKAQMLEGLIEFIEQSAFTLVGQIADRGDGSQPQAAQLVTMLLQFAEKNPGMTRVMVGDALVFENERLQQRMNLFFDKFEAALRQALQGGDEATDDSDAAIRASVLCAFAVGRLQRFARSGFRRMPSENLEASLGAML